MLEYKCLVGLPIDHHMIYQDTTAETFPPTNHAIYSIRPCTMELRHLTMDRHKKLLCMFGKGINSLVIVYLKLMKSCASLQTMSVLLQIHGC